jgi:hypothetical protein
MVNGIIQNDNGTISNVVHPCQIERDDSNKLHHGFNPFLQKVQSSARKRLYVKCNDKKNYDFVLFVLPDLRKN